MEHIQENAISGSGWYFLFVAALSPSKYFFL
jgi:hypothetical protein